MEITVRLDDEAAEQLAQFVKRSQFDMFYELTEAHLPENERKRLAYLMIDGIQAVGAALADAGHDPR